MSGAGICYLTGAGPGNPALLTLRALEVLRVAEVLIYDKLINENILALAPGTAQKFYAGKREGRHEMKQADINCLMVEQVRAGRIVVRLKGGDPFTFGRGGEEAEALTAAGLKFEVIPGVTSGTAVPAYAGIPLTHRHYSGQVVFVTGHECPKESGEVNWEQLARLDGTLVVYMGVRNLSNVVERLLAAGKDPATPVAFIQSGTLANQRSVVATLKTIVDEVGKQGLGAPAIIVIGAVAAMGKSLPWFQPGPLAGRRIVITRTRRQNGRLRELLIMQGAEVLELPLLETVSVSPGALPGDIRWLVFTSVNGVEYFMRFWRTARDLRGLADYRIAAVGTATAEALKNHGLDADFVPTLHNVQALVKQWPEPVGGGGILHVCGNLAEPLIFKDARGMEIPAGRLVVYETREEPQAGERFREIFEAGSPDWVVFCSQSAVKSFARLAGGSWPQGLKIASIGPVTSEAVRNAGAVVRMEASDSRLEVLVDELALQPQ